MDIQSISRCAAEAARIGGEILREGFGTSFFIENKEGVQNLVTEYDKKSENAIIDYIHSSFPEHSFLAEESGSSFTASNDTVRWIIDPLDGTVNFAHNVPIFCVSVAAELRGEILCGAIYHPLLEELFTAEKGKGVFLNGKRVNASNKDTLEESIFVTGFPYNVNENPGNCIDQFVDLIRKGLPIRRLGSAALDLAYVAAGRFEAFWEVQLQPWDVAAGMLMVREAGGTVTHYDGAEYSLGTGTVLATNGRIHGQMLHILNR